MKTVFVTGSGGYIGSHVVPALLKADVEVVTLDTSEKGAFEGARHIVGNLLSPSFSILDYFETVPDVCLHLAWRNGFRHNDASHMQDLSGHFAFIESLIRVGVPQVAVMGSMHEIGYWEGSITDTSPCNPQSLYGVAKDALRRATFLLAKDSDTRIQWLRGFYIYGDDEGSQSIFGKLLRAASQGDKTFPFTSGQNQYDFLHVDELSSQIASCVLQDKVNGIINCCSGEPVSLADRVESFIVEQGLDISLEYGAFPDRPYDSPAVWGDASKIKTIQCNEA